MSTIQFFAHHLGKRQKTDGIEGQAEEVFVMNL